MRLWLSVLAIFSTILIDNGIASQRAFASKLAADWVIRDRDFGCYAIRYANGVKVEIESRPIDRNTIIDFSERGTFSGAGGGSADITINGRTVYSDLGYNIEATVDPDIFWNKVKLPEIMLKLESLKSISVKTSAGKNYNVDVSGISKAAKSNLDCEQRLLKKWNIPLSEPMDVKIPAVAGDGAPWIDIHAPRNSQIPRNVTMTTMIWKIGIDGLVTDCQIAESGGSKELDDMLCTEITSLGRYKPALNAAGHPTPMHKILRVGWQRND